MIDRIATSISFSSIELATNNNARFLLKYIDADSGEAQSLALKLETYQASVSLYRAITEKHAFYSCETVRSAVTSQFVRDLKGTIASFFNENTDLGREFELLNQLKCENLHYCTTNWFVVLFVRKGKKYLFDIQRTCREVYDNARRMLHHQNSQPHLAVLPVELNSPSPVGDSSSNLLCIDPPCKV